MGKVGGRGRGRGHSECIRVVVSTVLCGEKRYCSDYPGVYVKSGL